MQIVHQAYARAGLIGNPSDGYNGKTIAFCVKNFSAQVQLRESDKLIFSAHESDQNTFDNLQSLHDQITKHGYYGGIRLVKGTVKVFVDYCLSHAIEPGNKNCELSYQTNIPQQVGLAGSSAIIIATLRCLMEFYGVDIDKRIQPSLALTVEKNELGIGGGLQDRVVQVYEGLVAMDFARIDMHGSFECGSYQPLNPALLPPLYLAYRPASSEPTEIFHNDLRARYDAGDTQVVNAMQRFITLTDQALDVLNNNRTEQLGALLDANFDCRQSFCHLNPQHVEMVEVARSAGVSAKYAGSGGAIIGTYDGEQQYEKLKSMLENIGCKVIKPEL